MKKSMKMIAVLLVVILAMSATAEASEKTVTIKPKLSISGSTATCKVKVSNPGHSIGVTLYLYKDNVSIVSWTRTDTSVVEIEETYTVSSGHIYYVYAYVTTNGHSYTKQSEPITI